MKRRNQNRQSPFPGRRSYEATKPGFLVHFMLWCISLRMHVCFVVF